MRIVFMGSPDFAVPSLNALVDAGHEVVTVYCQPPRPAGRGKAERKTAVHERAEQLGIEVRTPRTLRDAGEQERFRALNADYTVVAAYGLILPKPILDAPKHGCINVHASLLPRWRGAAPIQRAILAGDEVSGVTIMQMDEGLDTGDMLLIERLPIAAADTTATLHDKLATLGGRMIVEALELAACGGFHPVKQPEAGVTYAHKIEKAESQIRWSDDAAQIARRLRAFDPFPGGVAQLDSEPLKVWRAEVVDTDGVRGEPGRVLAVSVDGPVVACGSGSVRLTELQRAGGKRLPAAAFLQARPLQVGESLG